MSKEYTYTVSRKRKVFQPVGYNIFIQELEHGRRYRAYRPYARLGKGWAESCTPDAAMNKLIREFREEVQAERQARKEVKP